MSERRYNDDEIKEIFERAAKGDAREQHAIVPGDEGMSLAQLQDIGREAGFDPARVAEAARSLEQQPAVVPRGSMAGMPVSVGRVVDLPRAPSDREWEMLVADLRETFGARGRVGAGGFREWSNGNLHAYIEPTASGYRLRLGTRKGNAAPLAAAGVVAMVAGAVQLVSRELGDALILFGIGAGAWMVNFIRLPRWAQQRERQMDYIADRARRLLEAPQPTT